MTKRCAVWLLSIVLWSSMGCGLPKTHYYVVESPHVRSNDTAPIPRRIAVERFQASRLLSDDRILYRENESEVNYYEYQRWTAPPVDVVTNYFSHRLKDSAVFSGVGSTHEGSNADLILRGRVRHFEEVDRGKEVSVDVALEAEVIERRTGSTLWRSEEECTRPVSIRTVASVVQGIQQCLDETASRLLNSMQQHIQKGKD